MNLSSLCERGLRWWIVAWAAPFVIVIVICHHVNVAYKNTFTQEGSGCMGPNMNAWRQGYERGGFRIGQDLSTAQSAASQRHLSFLRFPGGDAPPFVAYMVVGSPRGYDEGYFLQFKADHLWRIQDAKLLTGTKYQLNTGDIEQVVLHSLYLKDRHFLAFEQPGAFVNDSALIDIAHLDHGSFNRCPVNYPKSNEPIKGNYYEPDRDRWTFD